MQLTEYNKYLLNLSQSIPVIDTVGYISSDGTHYKWSEVSPYTDLLNKYEKLQYNSIFDTANLDTDTFFLKGYTHEASDLSIEENESVEE